MEHCPDHSGLNAKIESLEMRADRQRVDINAIMARLNVVIGGVAVSCILLALNIVFRFEGLL